MTDRPHVVIVGAGFGGLAAAKRLARAAVDITVVDQRNHHVFQPLLYQVATAGLNPSDIAQPIRSQFRDQDNCVVRLAEVTDIDVSGKSVLCGDQAMRFDYLIVATGATHAYFGHGDWATHAPGLKTIEDALEIRRRILLSFERAESATSIEERARETTFVVVGGGPTGVELAGAIREIAMKSLQRDFRTIDTRESRVILVEAADRVLRSFPEKLSLAAERQLADLGVELQTNTSVVDISAAGVTTDRGFVPTATTIWAAGVAASTLASRLGGDLDRAGRVQVAQDLSVPGQPQVFAIGDLAAFTQSDGTPVPGVAPAAQQGGRHAAECIVADLAGAARPSFVYQDKGSLATIGRSKAVADLGRFRRFSGYPAWLVWWLVHIWSIIDFRSRLRVMWSWAWQYLTGHRHARLITGSLEPAAEEKTP